MSIKSADGMGVIDSVALENVTGTETILAAPGAGMKRICLGLTGTASGTFVLESPAGTVVFRLVPSANRPFSSGHGAYLFECPDNALLRISSGVITLNGVLTFETRPA